MRTIGRYALLTRLGSGHLGDVYSARAADDDAETSVAIKLLRSELVDDLQFSRLLLAEAPAAIAFRHPSALEILEVDRDGPEAYVAMGLLSGQPLSLLVQRARVEGERVDHRLVAWIGARIASALAAAHEVPWFSGTTAKLVHGALSPRSVFLTYDGDVKLLGMGVGRARRVAPMNPARLPYAAPELLKDADPTPRSDVYGLGTVLYEAFSGRNIFRRANEDDTRAAVRDANAPPLNSTHLDIDASVGDLLAEMMAPRIEARPESLEDVAAQLFAAAGDDAGLPEALSRRMLTTFREEREARDRMMGAATRAQSAVRAGRPRASSGIGPIAGAVEADDDDEIPIDEATPVPAHEWSSDIDTNQTIEERMPPELAAQIAAKQRGDAPASSDDDTYDLESTKRIARYRTESMIARSATTATFLARDPNVGRTVVVKAFDPQFVTDARLARAEWVRLFKREARLAGQVAHPNLPTLYDAGRDGSLYFVSYEHVAGETLARAMQREPVMAQSRVRSIVVAVAEALAHLHDRGVVHCDVRPSNVMLQDDGRVRLIDLSMAASVDEAPHPLLATNAMTLSPEYLDGHGYGPSSDQFALGMLLYQMLVGSRPFKGVDDAELVLAIRTKSPTPPEELEAHVNPTLSQYAMRMIEKDPADRFPGCDAIANALMGPKVSRVPTTDLLHSRGAADVLDESETTDQDRAVAARVSVESMASAFVAICERVSTMSTQRFNSGAHGEPADAALAVARRLAVDETTEVLARLAAGLYDLADRLRVPVTSEEMTPLVPAELAPVVEALDRMVAGHAVSSPAPVAAEIAFVVHSYFGATSPRRGAERVSPRRAVLGLREAVGTIVREEVVAALVEHLRETISALDLSPKRSDAPRVLVAGNIRSDALVHALEFDGFVVDEAQDGHGAWEKLRHVRYAGAVLDATLAGRNGASLIRLCRAHPDTAHVRFVLIGGGPTADLLAPDPAVVVLEASSPIDEVRRTVSRLMGP